MQNAFRIHCCSFYSNAAQLCMCESVCVHPLSQSPTNIGNDTWTIQYPFCAPGLEIVTVEMLADKELGT